ncbi:hypothetical protein K493DRAFT_361931 [Basidiobolus meristosporus CBS 931.73]|uniref:Uncharacterized protein n=1 Tax=Basidiobolus meristosporus CBS 931.73 TaxID=1314790 RepID=A0A1Y1X5U1_9FUNG|nr:hypothetical protein K493DRAFT_361931 [Basidiobolus meristosporus CBS 931.73]|eukprot:ORX81179.1 hypothetical protein K493DRAFT_361931 [Basidiobolus meristosporus CBS 931.73]
MFLSRSSTAPEPFAQKQLTLKHAFTVDRKSFLSRDLFLNPVHPSQPTYVLKRKTTHHIYYQIDQVYRNLAMTNDGVTIVARRRAFRRAVSLECPEINLHTELSKVSMFSTKYSFVWNAETYLWKRHEYGNLNMACICPRTGSLVAEFRWRTAILPQLKNIGDLHLCDLAMRDPKFQSVLMAAFFVTLDALLEC